MQTSYFAAERRVCTRSRKTMTTPFMEMAIVGDVIAEEDCKIKVKVITIVKDEIYSKEVFGMY